MDGWQTKYYQLKQEILQIKQQFSQYKSSLGLYYESQKKLEQKSNNLEEQFTKVLADSQSDSLFHQSIIDQKLKYTKNNTAELHDNLNQIFDKDRGGGSDSSDAQTYGQNFPTGQSNYLAYAKQREQNH